MQREDSSAAIVEAIVALAHRLQIAVTAEGVETVGQRDEIVRLGGDAIQGYYLGHPLPDERFVATIGSPAPG